MNATKWLTLTEFVKHLGKEGKCRVDETPKGWFISLIQADPMAELSAERRVKRDRHVVQHARAPWRHVLKGWMEMPDA
jgi:DNA/RNA-binding protein KIN17